MSVRAQPLPVAGVVIGFDAAAFSTRREPRP